MPVVLMRISIQNQTNSATLIRGNFHPDHGIWSPSDQGDLAPPEVVPPQTTLVFQNESDGAATGCQGFVIYDVRLPDVGSIGSISITWNIPFFNPFTRNHFNCDAHLTNGSYTMVAGVDNQFPDGYTIYGLAWVTAGRRV